MNKVFIPTLLAAALFMTGSVQAKDLTIQFETPATEGPQQSWTMTDIGVGSTLTKQIGGLGGEPLELALKVEKIDGDQVVTSARIYEVKDAMFGRTRRVLVSEQEISAMTGESTGLKFKMGGTHAVSSTFLLRLSPTEDGAMVSGH